MTAFNDTLIEELAARLGKLPAVQTGVDRHESWMTAEQIGAWLLSTHQISLAADEIEHALIEWWKKDPAARPLRPAKYPSLTTCCRLWGHISRVNPSAEPLEIDRTSEPVVLEHIELPENAPSFFVSYSFRDLHLAARLRLSLARDFGIRAWLADENLAKGEHLFEGVKAAISACVGVLVLITRHSLGSAWVVTEMTTALGLVCERAGSFAKPVVFAADANDRELVKLLASWKALPAPVFDEVDLVPLQAAFSLAETNPHRCAMYPTNARMLLGHISPAQIRVGLYPRRPPGWTGHERFANFTDVIAASGLALPTPGAAAKPAPGCR